MYVPIGYLPLPELILKKKFSLEKVLNLSFYFSINVFKYKTLSIRFFIPAQYFVLKTDVGNVLRERLNTHTKVNKTFYLPQVSINPKLSAVFPSNSDVTVGWI